MDRERAILFVVMKFHLGGVIAGFTVDEIADGGVFDNHFGPEGIAREAEKEGAFIGSYFNYNVSPAGDNMLSINYLMLR